MIENFDLMLLVTLKRREQQVIAISLQSDLRLQTHAILSSWFSPNVFELFCECATCVLFLFLSFRNTNFKRTQLLAFMQKQSNS